MFYSKGGVPVGETEKSSRHPLLVVGTMAGVVLLLLVVLVVALLWPPSPETVVSELLVAIRQQDAARTIELAVGPARSDLEAVVIDGEVGGRWHQFWANGSTLFREFRVAEADIDGDGAKVMVYYGQGLFQEQVFILRKEDKNWRVYDLDE